MWSRLTSQVKPNSIYNKIKISLRYEGLDKGILGKSRQRTL